MVLVLPGYFSLKLIRYLGQLKRKLSDSELLYMSLGFSLVIYVIAGFILKIKDFDEIKNIIIQPDKTFTLMSITTGIGILIGFIIRYWRNRKGYVREDSWMSVMGEERDIDLPWIIVFTTDGKEYEGVLNYYGEEHEQKDISILSPIKILRDEKFNIIGEIDLGEEMYFTEKNIARILFFKKDANENEVNKDKTRIN